MKSAIRKIDRALKALYNIDSGFRAEDFLIGKPPGAAKATSAHCQGTLFIRQDQDLEVGIYLNDQVLAGLSKVRWQSSMSWSHEQLSAFAVAAEEVSHFHYLLFNASSGRPVSHFELELQGEIDKFLLSYFVGSMSPVERAQRFTMLFEKIYEQFRFQDGLSEEERNRYSDANRFAMRFVQKWGRQLQTGTLPELALRMLRKFYRLGTAEKVSFISGD